MRERYHFAEDEDNKRGWRSAGKVAFIWVPLAVFAAFVGAIIASNRDIFTFGAAHPTHSESDTVKR